jgi:hypothetical protein
MPCHLVIFDPEARVRSEYDCDEANTSRVVGDDHAAKAAGSYTDIDGRTFDVDWTRSRLVGFTRKRDDGSVIASGGADGSQTPC